MSKSSAASAVPQVSAPRRTRFSNTKRHPAAKEPTLAEQNELLITRALALVDEQIEASKVLREVERLRAENKRLSDVESEHVILLEAFTDPTDKTSAHTGVLRFVAQQLEAMGWANAREDDSSTACLLTMLEGDDATRHFRFLAALVTMAAKWSDQQVAHAAGGAR